MTALLRTRDQERAATAYECVHSVKDAAYADDYGRMALKLPVLVRSAGLAQALAFVEAKGTSKDGYKKLLEHIGRVTGETDLAQASRSAPLSRYMQLTHEVLAACLWFKRFSQSVLNADASKGDE